MIDIKSENLLTVRQAARRIPGRRRGKSIHITAVYRWIQGGVHGVHLAAAQIGGTTYTSVEALQRFSEALTTARQGPGSVKPLPRRVEAAREELGRHGF